MEQTIDQKQTNPLILNSGRSIKGFMLGSVFGFVLGVLIGGGIGYLALNNMYFEKQVELKNQISEAQLNQQKEAVPSEANDSQNIINKSATLTKINEDDSFVNYSGSIVVSGKYQEIRPGWNMGGNLCFYADSDTGYLIPRDPNLYGEGVGDKRTPWFCFKDQDAAKRTFGIEESEVFGDKTIDCIEGKAVVEVSDYVVNKLESQVFDTASLDKIISKEGYSSRCE